ncbi:MAG: hypothetical protein ACRCZF_26225, partial [Gemmataceae bacterium]
MTRLEVLLEALGQALCEKARGHFTRDTPLGEVLPDVAKQALSYIQKHLASDEIRLALAEVASVKTEQYEARLDAMLAGLARVQPLTFRTELRDYFSILPNTIRQMFRRPSDPTGRTAPEKIEFYKPENLLVFLPPRRARFRVGDNPAHLDNWVLTELRGIGECGEVWMGRDRTKPDEPPVALKFAIDPHSKARIVENQALFVSTFELNEINGIIPLRSVYLDCDPPCLESTFVYGYDLAGLMHDWKWRFGDPKPEASFKIIRRVVEIVARAHDKRLIHR